MFMYCRMRIDSIFRGFIYLKNDAGNTELVWMVLFCNLPTVVEYDYTH